MAHLREPPVSVEVGVDLIVCPILPANGYRCLCEVNKIEICLICLYNRVSSNISISYQESCFLRSHIRLFVVNSRDGCFLNIREIRERQRCSIHSLMCFALTSTGTKTKNLIHFFHFPGFESFPANTSEPNYTHKSPTSIQSRDEWLTLSVSSYHVGTSLSTCWLLSGSA